MKRKPYYTVDVRHASDPRKAYTYRVARGKKLKLGDEVVVDNSFGTSVAFVVRIHEMPQYNRGFDYKYITRKVAAL